MRTMKTCELNRNIISYTLQGAGGIGGLLSVTESSTNSLPPTTYYPAYDAIRLRASLTTPGQDGNITEYADTNGTIVAHYEYNPFGGLITSSGTKANDFKFRFSTKCFDAEIDLYYYGYRYYSTDLGRWINRDPLQELGGLNLYGFLRNDPLNRFDPLGLLSWSDLVGAYNAAKAALDAAKQCMQTVQDAFDRRDQGTGDKLNHCMSSCEISEDCGEKIADALGTIKEARDLSVGGIEWLLAWVIPKSWEEWVHDHIQGGSFQDSVDDFVANFTGFDCKDDPDGCECCCVTDQIDTVCHSQIKTV